MLSDFFSFSPRRHRNRTFWKVVARRFVTLCDDVDDGTTSILHTGYDRPTYFIENHLLDVSQNSSVDNTMASSSNPNNGKRRDFSPAEKNVSQSTVSVVVEANVERYCVAAKKHNASC